MSRPQMGHREFIAFSATMGITIAFAIDAILPAFDDMKESLGLDPDSNSIALAITAYFLAMSSAQLVYGPMADRFGRKPTLAVGLSIYIAGAAISTFAPNLAMLLAGRAVWGFGAASLRVIQTALARDLYAGDTMARVLSVIMAVFLLGPIVAPLVGEAVLSFASWRVLLAVCGSFAFVTALWSLRLRETLRPEDRRPLGFASTGEGFRAVIRTRAAVGNTLAVMFIFAVLATFLASSQLVIDEIYGRADQFAVLFSILSVGSAAMAFLNSKLVEHLGSRRVMRYSTASFIVTGGFLTVVSVGSDGQPDFWVWFAATTVMIAFVSSVIPTGTAVALEPLGHVAGTAAGVIGTMSAGGGAILGALVDMLIDDSVTPMSAAAFVFGALAYASARWAQAAPRVSQSV